MELGRILIVEDDSQLLDQLKWALKGQFAVTGAGDATRARELLGSEPDLFLFDLRLPPSGRVEEGLELLREVRRRDPEATVVMMSAEEDRLVALRSIDSGAFDFFRKPIDPAELIVILKRAFERRRLLRENREWKEAASSAARGPEKLVGSSAAMRRLFAEIDKVAATDATILLQGESGTGKELVAHAIHERSGRSRRTFVAVNVSALPETLAEAELFGHEKGAFTGAVASRPGRFELAHGGSLFLDEIGTLSAAVQAKLLRAIESREIERVGGRRPIPVDFRLISATNEDLESRATAGTFREDLLFRINTITIQIPPLRERQGDIGQLAKHFLTKYSSRHARPARRLDEAALERLEAHPWRGNVRELEHAIEALVLFSESEVIGPEDLPRALRTRPSSTAVATKAASFSEAVSDFERKVLADAIAQAGGVKAEAARRLGLDANQIKYLCRKYDL